MTPRTGTVHDLRRRMLFVGGLLVAAALFVLAVRAYRLTHEHRVFYLLSLPAAPVHRPREQRALVARLARLLRFTPVHAIVVRRKSALVHFGEIFSITTGVPIDFRSGSITDILKKAVARKGRPRLYVALRTRLPAWLRAVPRPLRHPILSLVIWSPLGGVHVYSFEPSFVLTAKDVPSPPG
jgi:hypothetical protein